MVWQCDAGLRLYIGYFIFVPHYVNEPKQWVQNPMKLSPSCATSLHGVVEFFSNSDFFFADYSKAYLQFSE